MNYEASKTTYVVDDNGNPKVAAGNRRTWLWGIFAIVIALAAIGWFAMRGEDKGAEKTAATTGAAAKNAGKTGGNLPNVTVIYPGMQNITRELTVSGALGARREMPVGVAGEGGQVLRVLVEPGQWVRAGQVLAIVDRQVQVQQLNSLAASIRVAEADARLAESELVRARSLIGRGFISKADLDRKIAARDIAAARVNVAKAQLSESQARSSRLDVRAPAAGLVLTRQVEVGQVIGAGSGVLFRMARDGEMELLAQMGEADLQNVSLGMSAAVTPTGSAREFNGTIWQKSPVIDPQSRQGTARIALPYDGSLRPGGFATARIRGGATQAPLLPESAVHSDSRGNYVMIVDANNVVQRVEVTLGTVSNAGVPVLQGLNGQEAVILSAGAFYAGGEKVKPVRQKPAAISVTPPASTPSPVTPSTAKGT
jgi:RND family efflux transporter MFP subunit